MVITSDFDARLHDSDLRGVTELAMNEYQPFYRSMFKTEGGLNKKYYREAYQSEVGIIPQELSETLPAAPVNYSISDEFVVRAKWRRASFTYLQRALKFDQFGSLKRAADSMGRQMVRAHELVAHSVFNLATDAAELVGWDRKTFANSAHKLINSSATYSNTVVGTASFSLLRTIRQYGAAIPDDNGNPRPALKTVIYHPSDDDSIWEQLIKSPTQYDQANAAVINPFQNVVHVSDPHLDGSVLTAVVLYDQPDLSWFDVEPTNTYTYNENNPRSMVHVIEWGGMPVVKDTRKVLFVTAS